MTFVSDNSIGLGAGSGTPVSDYTSRDYSSIYADLLARIPIYLPEWTSQSPNDFGIVLLQMFAYVGDILGYYIDRIAGEAFLQTATQPQSILSIASMLDYSPYLSVGSTAMLTITISNSVVGPVTIPAGSVFSTIASPNTPPIQFETVGPLTISGPGATPSYSGSVLAFQGTTVSNEQVNTSDGTANQTYALQQNPVSATVPSILGASIVEIPGFQVFVDVGLGPQQWTYVPVLINSGPQDYVFTYFVDANGVFYIVFGDNVNGYAPPLGSPITATYVINVGSQGNVGASTITQAVSVISGVTSVTNPLVATGGSNAESLASIAANAPLSLRALNRVVTAFDIQTLTLLFSGVQAASAQEVTYQLVNLYVEPVGGGQPSATLFAGLAAYLDPLTMVNTTVTFFGPTYVGINVTATVTIASTYGNTTTLNNVIAALTTLLDSAGFAFRVSLSLIYQTIMQVPGVLYVSISQLGRWIVTTLTSGLISGTPYTSLPVAPLPYAVATNDTIILTNLNGQTQTVTASAPAVVGAVSISVTSFVAAFSFPINSEVADVTGTTGASDCILAVSEVPVVGNFGSTTSTSISVIGGVLGS